MDTKDIFNYDDLLHRLLGDSELAATIIDGFLEEIPGHLAKLEAAVSGDNLDGAAKIAHYMKGEAGNIGAPALRQTAADMETALKSGNRALIAAALETVRNTVGELTDHLRSWKP
jgi:HPt (histidine-containing phosphotransfer) domain-containing protein